jgi:subtilase family serine protease
VARHRLLPVALETSTRRPHDFLTPAEFGAAFGPTTQQAGAVESALRADGLTADGTSNYVLCTYT